jgi:hypothetical protein
MVLRVAGKLPVADSGVVVPPEALALNLLRVRPFDKFSTRLESRLATDSPV